MSDTEKVERVEKGLAVCQAGDRCWGCPYFPHGGGCVNELMKDAAEIIRQMKNGGETPAPVEV